MNDVLASIILASQAIVVALITVFGPRILRDAKAAKTDASAARYQLENDHSTNLRVENDERHGENRDLLEAILGAVNWLKAMALSNAGRITDLEEHTGQQPQTRRERRLAAQPPTLITEVPPNLERHNP